MLSPRSVLPPEWEVPEEFRARLGQTAGRQRAMYHQKHLLIILHDPASPDDDERTAQFFWRKPDGKWQSTRPEEGTAALAAQIDAYENIIDELDDLEDDADSADAFLEILRRLNPLMRAIRNLYEALQQARELVKEDRRLINVRDRADALQRKSDLLYNDIRHDLDYAIARQAEKQAEATHRMATATYRLNLMVAFFLPVATMSAIFGMNLATGLEMASSPWVFLSVIVVGLSAGIALTRFMRRGRGEG
jgi:Mg2+ and Co2+ transporter CorA